MEKRGKHSICRERIAKRSFAAALCFLAFVLSIGGLTVPRDKAIANPGLALSFISECASAAGMTEGAFVASIVGSIGVATGLNIANDFGVSLGDSAADNLGHLLDSADYPEWDTLTPEKQALYGSKADYDASKFNSLMRAFGLEDDYTAYSGWYGSGGSGDFEFSTQGQERLQQIGRIGNQWAKSIGTTVGEVKSLFENPAAVGDYFPSGGIAGADMSGLSLWPFPDHTSVSLNYGSYFAFYSNNDPSKPYGSFAWRTSREVYAWVTYYHPNGDDGGYIAIFDSLPFEYSQLTWNSSTNSYEWGALRSASRKTYNTYVAYIAVSAGMNIYSNTNPGMLVRDNINLWGVNDSTINQAITMILTRAQTSNPLESFIPEYPEGGPDDDEMVWFPETQPGQDGEQGRNGLNADTEWPDFTKPQRPENPFNPDDDTGKPEWKDETKSNLAGLSAINFDKLFPFSMMYNIPKLFEHAQQYVEMDSSSVQSYRVIRIPINYDGETDNDLVIDLDWLATLLITVRPVIQLLLIVAAVMSLILFWKGILTGD